MHISEFQKLMEDLYSKNDEKRGSYKTFLWLIEEIGELSEALRLYEEKQSFKEKNIQLKKQIEEEMADITAWLASLANLYEINLEKACIEKYPQKCSKCNNNPCTCE